MAEVEYLDKTMCRPHVWLSSHPIHARLNSSRHLILDAPTPSQRSEPAERPNSDQQQVRDPPSRPAHNDSRIDEPDGDEEDGDKESDPSSENSPLTSRKRRFEQVIEGLHGPEAKRR